MSRGTRTGWWRVEVPPRVGVLGDIWAYQKDLPSQDREHLSVFVGIEPPGWHLSISHRRHEGDKIVPGRYPTWDEITEARYEFCPAGITMAMLLPPRDQYVNLHDTTFHLWEIPTESPRPT